MPPDTNETEQEALDRYHAALDASSTNIHGKGLARSSEPRRASDRQVAGDHYKKMGIQPWDVVDTWPLEQRIGYYRGSALKYIMRMGTKDENLAEAGKGQHYIEKLLEVLKERDSGN